MVLGAASPVQAASADNFTITNYDAVFDLGRDTDNRSILKTTLTITADFPAHQNHGIAPVFVKEYDGHSTHFTLQSVTDGSGNRLEYSWNGNALQIGNKDSYVEGRKTYVITYTERDVTKHYGDTNKDEFYWDVIGAEWRVPIEQAKVAIRLDDPIASAKQTKLQCYVGATSSGDSCRDSVAVAGDTMILQTSNLPPGHGVTMALGFAPGTFAAYQPSLLDRLLVWWGMAQVILTLIGVGCLIWLIMAGSKAAGRSKELNPIVPEYLPPKNISVMVSSKFMRSFGVAGSASGSAMTAQLLDLAVRHYVKLYEVAPKTTFRPAQYEIEIIQDLSGLKPEEQELVSDMFGAAPRVGDKLNLKTLQNNYKYTARTTDDTTKLIKLINGEYALRAKNDVYTKHYRRWALVYLIISIVLLSPMLLIVAATAFGLSFGKVLTDDGLALRRYLLGLKMYIGVAEQERLKLLQSPEGAEKVGVIDGADTKQLIKLYERVLPYAVLFNQEKEWSKQIGSYYEQTASEPDWYHGTAAFSAAAFVSGMNGLAATATSASSASSSTGGSSGGGSVGGGGGGGGGGGW